MQIWNNHAAPPPPKWVLYISFLYRARSMLTLLTLTSNYFFLNDLFLQKCLVQSEDTYNPDDAYNIKTIIVRAILILAFLNVSAADRNALFVSLKPSPERLGEVRRRDTSNGPLQFLLEAVLGQGEARRLPLDPGEEELVRWCQIQRIWQVFDQFDVPGRQPISHFGGGVNWSIIPMK
jgi:hypothetical protein